MASKRNDLNLVMSGGGIKGLAFIGVLDVAEQLGYRWGNIAGVSAGALAGSFVSAGYNVSELRETIEKFNFGNIKLDKLEDKVPAISRYIQFQREYNSYRYDDVSFFLNNPNIRSSSQAISANSEFYGYRCNFLKNVVSFSEEGCLFDGDYLEDWVYRVLAARGIRTFADVRGGIVDRVNPRGYRIRMTAVDANRGKVIVLPDDIAYYGIDPDMLEVAKAVRMSTAVPFAFKPVKIQKKDADLVKTYNIVDGGVFDNFPVWLIDNSTGIPAIGCKLVEREKNKILSLDTPLKILKALVSAVQDIGIPKYVFKTNYVIKIDTSNVSFLDFSLDEFEKEYLYNQGKLAAVSFFNNFHYKIMSRYRNNMLMFYPVFRRRFF